MIYSLGYRLSNDASYLRTMSDLLAKLEPGLRNSTSMGNVHLCKLFSPEAMQTADLQAAFDELKVSVLWNWAKS